MEEEFPGDGERLQWTIIAIGCGAGFVVIVLFTSVVIVTCRRKKENIDWEAPDLEHYEGELEVLFLIKKNNHKIFK